MPSRKNDVLTRLEASGKLPVDPQLDGALGVRWMRLKAAEMPSSMRNHLLKDLKTGVVVGASVEGPLGLEEALELHPEASSGVFA